MDVFDLVAKLTLDSSEYDKGLDNSEKKASSFGDKLKGGLASAAKIGTAALGAAAGAVGALTKQAIDNYANYEQLIGGVETLFGDSAQKVIADASEAFKTAGLSANEYMETSIQSAAALINSLGGDQAKAAELMNVSITDMADNVNKMGTSMEAVQNAYRGFSRGNFTMLDNLALGYAGTKEGMQELLDKAMEIEQQQGRNTQFSIDSYSDIVEAIHVVQDEMGITGTTAEEASGTISGSLSAAKSAWENLITGIANGNADMDALIGNFVESAKTVGANIFPAIETSLKGIGELVTGLAPVVVDALSGLVEEVLPDLLATGGEAIITIGTGILNNLPSIVSSGLQVIVSLAKGISSHLSELIPTIVDVVLQIVETLTEPDTLVALVDASIAIIIALADGLIEALPKLIEKAPVIIANLVTAIIEAAPKLLSAAWKLIVTLADGIISNLGEMAKAAGRIITTLIDGLGSLIDSFLSVGGDIVRGIWQGISNGFTWIKDKITGWVGDLVGFFKKILGISSPSKVFREQIGQNVALGVAEGISDKSDKAVKAADDLAKDVYSRSKEWADRQTKYQKYTLDEQIELWEAIQSQFIEGSKQYADAEEKLFDLREKQVKEALDAEQKQIKDSFAFSKRWIERQTKYFGLSLDDQIAAWERVIVRYEAGTTEYLEAEERLFDLRQQRLDNQADAEKDFEKSIETVWKNIDALEETYQNKLASRTEQIANSFKLFDEVPKRQSVSGYQLLNNLRQQNARIEEFYNGLDKLSERGVGEALVEEIRAMGVGANDQLNALLSLSDDRLSEYARLFGEKQQMANDIATRELAGFRAETDEEIQKSMDSISDIFQNVIVEAKDWGADLIQSFIDGITSMGTRLKYTVTDMLDFAALGDNNMGNVDFASSAIGKSSEAIINNNLKKDAVAAHQPIIAQWAIDGRVIAEQMIDPLGKAARQRGTPILNRG